MKKNENKEKQGFLPKCPCCGNCANFTCEIVEEKGYFEGQVWHREKGLRCTLGEFAVKKQNWCKMHRLKGNG